MINYLLFSYILGFISFILALILKCVLGKIEDENEMVAKMLFVVIMVAMILLGTYLVLSGDSPGDSEVIRVVEEKEFNVHSMNLDEGDSDKFILGTGFVDQNIYYYFYRETESGGLILDSLRADEVELLMTLSPGETPHYMEKHENTDINKLYLPKNSIKKDIGLNLQKNPAL